MTMLMKFSEYLSKEWVPALGCTEPASIALATATAVSQLKSPARRVSIICDPRIYKNCYAVGIPRSSGKTGILWAAAIGANISDPSLGLECFSATTPEIISASKSLIDENSVTVDVDAAKTSLFIDCRVEGKGENARAIISGEHTNIVRVEHNGQTILEKPISPECVKSEVRAQIAKLSIDEMITMARSAENTDRKRLNDGIALNIAIAKHGRTLFPDRFIKLAAGDELTRIATHVCAGVYARMCGEEFPVMTLAGSGNKGITASVPIAMHGKSLKLKTTEIEDALGLACLVTSATTFHLGTLSAVCGCSNAAGIGLAAGLVLMEKGSSKEIGLAINNMVGNVSGMICDGAKIGCALKTMTAVDAAFRASSLAMSGIGIPVSDGIVGATGLASLENLGRIATLGMTSTDKEILAIMKEKLSNKNVKA